MKKNIISCVIALVLCVALSLGVSFPLANISQPTTDENIVKGAIYEEDFTPTKDKAMIFIPGLMASSFFDAETGEQLWGIDGFINIVKTTDKQVEKLLSIVATDEEMVPTYVMKMANMNTKDAYGSFGGMKHSFDVLYPIYKDSYDFVVWQYDWRYSNTFAAEKLERFINNCDYDKVVFVTHSMGGIVVANYLTKAENREKVEVFVPYGAPFFGSFDAINNLFYPEEEGSDTGSQSLIDTVFSLVDLKLMARSLASVYELLPFEEIRSWNEYEGEKNLYSFDNKEINVSYLDNYIWNQAWSKNKEGKVKTLIANVANYRERFFVEVNGKRTFVTELVNTEYVVGMGVKTLIGANFIAETGEINNLLYSDGGDGTVPAYSASAGLPFDAENVHIVEGVEHGPLANPPVAKTGLRFLADAVAKHTGK